jgi:hypothetical protein
MEQAKDNAAAQAEPKVKKARQVRSINVRLDGEGQQLHIRAYKIAGGRWRSEAIVITGTGKKAKRERGLTTEHADEAAAKVAIDKAADDAAKLGWQRKAARSFVRKADAFTSIPKPAKVRK